MQDKEKHIESLYRSQLASLSNWRERELSALHKENSMSPTIIPPPPAKILDFEWKGTIDELKQVHEFFMEERILPRIKENSLTDFIDHIYNTSHNFNPIKLLNTKKALWCFFILQHKNKISDKPLYDILPQHCTKIYANGKKVELNRKSLITELSEMGKMKPTNYPAYVNELLFILKIKS